MKRLGKTVAKPSCHGVGSPKKSGRASELVRVGDEDELRARRRAKRPLPEHFDVGMAGAHQDDASHGGHGATATVPLGRMAKR